MIDLIAGGAPKRGFETVAPWTDGGARLCTFFLCGLGEMLRAQLR